MPFALTLRVDEAAAAHVQALWTALAERGLSDSGARLGYEPHVTLCICDDATEPADLIAAAHRVCGNWTGLHLNCPAIGIFPGSPNALFIGITPTEALLVQQQALCQALPQERLHPHYQPNRWLPHVTLADDLPPERVAAATAETMRIFQPFSTRFPQLDLVRFRPVKLLWHADLETSPG